MLNLEPVDIISKKKLYINKHWEGLKKKETIFADSVDGRKILINIAIILKINYKRETSEKVWSHISMVVKVNRCSLPSSTPIFPPSERLPTSLRLSKMKS